LEKSEKIRHRTRKKVLFQAEELEGFQDITLLRTCNTFLHRPLMWAYFTQIDNVLIDTGSCGNHGFGLLSFLKNKESGNEWQILNTHLHEDHCGNNGLLQREFGSRVLAAWRREGFREVTRFYRFFWGRPDLFDSERLDKPVVETSNGTRLEVIPTPGHTPCHTSFYLAEADLLMTGDAVPLAVNKEFSMPEENYLQSLETLRSLLKLIKATTVVIDSHRGVLRKPVGYIQERIDNMDSNVQAVRERWENGLDVSEIAEKVFSKPNMIHRLAGSRFSLENTIRSIVSYDKS
jgi:glyoxylase-like metal-dependent hydrolase (beta-lactamase superfamily II)